MKTIDDYYLAKEIIAQHFRRRRNLVATFMPKPVEG